MGSAAKFVRRLFSRRSMLVLGAVLGILAVAIAINVIGIQLVGDVSGWNQWLTNHRFYFLAWRLCLYGLTAYGWWWMRKRIQAREPGTQPQIRLRRAEIAAVLTIILLETTTLLHSS